MESLRKMWKKAECSGYLVGNIEVGGNVEEGGLPWLPDEEYTKDLAEMWKKANW
jgi:hypothetical protein